MSTWRFSSNNYPETLQSMFAFFKSVEFVAELPKNNYGKVLKRELRARYWQGRDRLV